MSLTKEPLVSVVTPVYNGEKYIEECIESILDQTYSNWEYIILNNCSTDRTLEIAKKYANLDKRIKVFDNVKFLNQIPNWNAVVKKISPESKYCKMVQADDWIYPECLVKMVGRAEEYPSAGVISAYRLVETAVRSDGLPYQIKFLSGEEICRKYFTENLNLFGSATTILFRSDLIRARNNFFNESVVHADSHACFDVLRESDFGFVHQVLTFTRRHNESTTTFCNFYNTYSIADIEYLHYYGTDFFDKKEHDLLLDNYLAKHHRSLVKLMIASRGKKVWKYHKKEIRKMGYRLNWYILFKSFLFELYHFQSFIKITVNGIKERYSSNNDMNDEKKMIENKKSSTVDLKREVIKSG